jgi:hypothetical protein
MWGGEAKEGERCEWKGERKSEKGEGAEAVGCDPTQAKQARPDQLAPPTDDTALYYEYVCEDISRDSMSCSSLRRTILRTTSIVNN